LESFFYFSYGVRIGLVQDQSTSQQNLIRLLKALKTHLKQKTVISSSSNVNNKTAPSTSTNPTLANLIATAATDNNANKLSMFKNFEVYFNYTIKCDSQDNSIFF
jgi:hypothetical protein